MKKAPTFFKGRLAWFCLLIGVQVLLLIGLLLLGCLCFPLFYGLLRLIGILSAVRILLREENPSYKIAWLSLILFFPLFGGVFYLVWGCRQIPRAHRKRIADLHRQSLFKIIPNSTQLPLLRRRHPSLGALAKYIHLTSGSPVCGNTRAEYLPRGEDFFITLCRELEAADRFILL